MRQCDRAGARVNVESRTMTTGQFVGLLYERVLSGYGYEKNEIFSRGRREGWLTESEELSGQEPLSRRDAARILHEILRNVIGEAEEEDFSAATQLADLYDCNRCVQHVAQVYVKGIMTGAVVSKETATERAELRETVLPELAIGEKSGYGVQTSGDILCFRGEDNISSEDAQLAVERLLHREKRIPPKPDRNIAGGVAVNKTATDGNEQKEGLSEQSVQDGIPLTAKRLSRAEAEHFFQTQEKALAVDVGSDTEPLDVPYRIQLPMMKLLENPFLLDAYRDHVLLLFCNGGYQSEIAANCLLQHGYSRVFYFGLEESVQ